MLKKDGVETVYPSNRIRYKAKLNSNPLAWHFGGVSVSFLCFFARRRSSECELGSICRS